MKSVVAQYLARYASPEQLACPNIPKPHTPYAHALVVPCYNEQHHLMHLLQSPGLAQSDGVLCVLVLNASTQSPTEVHTSNGETRQLLNQHFTTQWKAEPFTLYQTSFGHILLIDRACERWFFKPHEGVGTARKTGCDMALAYAHAGHLDTPWIHQTDADAWLPEGYFSNLPKNGVALLYPFTHTVPENETHAHAMHVYEQSLRYYAAGHTFAGSGYDHISIGSVFAVHKEAYAHVRGMPQRQAGEDFHMLNKLRKTGVFTYIKHTDPIRLSCRLSDRVPFGTGKAVHSWMHAEKIRWIHPLCFDVLKQWHAHTHTGLTLGHNADTVWDRFMRHDKALQPHLEELNRSLGLHALLHNAVRSSAHAEQRLKHLFTGFDALATLRFLHTLRDLYYGTLDWEDALLQAPFYWQEATEPDTAHVLLEAAQSSPGTN